MAKDAELKEEKKKKRKSEVADLDVEDKKSKKEKRKSLAAEDEKAVSVSRVLLVPVVCAPRDEVKTTAIGATASNATIQS